MVDETDGRGAASGPLKGLIASIAQTSVRAANELGVEFDVEDPRVARWLMLTTFEAMFMPSTSSTQTDLLRRAAGASEPELGTGQRKRSGKRRATQPLVTCNDLVASAANAE